VPEALKAKKKTEGRKVISMRGGRIDKKRPEGGNGTTGL